MKKLVLILVVALAFSCTGGKLCPYTGDILRWSSQAAQDGITAAHYEQLIQAAVKAKKYDSVAIYTAQALAFAPKLIQDKDSIAFYTNKCKADGYDTVGTNKSY